MLDLHSYLYITSRSKEIINKGGEVISPFEVEEAIMVVAKDFVKVRSFRDCLRLSVQFSVTQGVLAFAIEHDVLQECIGVVIIAMPTQPRIGLSQLQDRLRCGWLSDNSRKS